MLGIDIYQKGLISDDNKEEIHNDTWKRRVWVFSNVYISLFFNKQGQNIMVQIGQIASE